VAVGVEVADIQRDGAFGGQVLVRVREAAAPVAEQHLDPARGGAQPFVGGGQVEVPVAVEVAGHHRFGRLAREPDIG
jgi:hypothetical protein